jgi:hypothetical protein
MFGVGKTSAVSSKKRTQRIVTVGGERRHSPEFPAHGDLEKGGGPSGRPGSFPPARLVAEINPQALRRSARPVSVPPTVSLSSCKN